MERILNITGYFSVCPIRRIPGGSKVLGNKPRWRKWRGTVKVIEN